ncbi:hypothetical protein [Myroides sp. DW712]|uniref:hypothetical protein n=1 Tax=Myroides sp. DW712 TaxID=3389800 RepID=UPI00397D17BB
MNFEVKRYKVLYYIFLVVFFCITTVQGQNSNVRNGMKLTDQSVSQPVSDVLPFSILELSSIEKGFLLPKMTMSERRNIPKADLQQGLMIYNTTIDCMEFYNEARDRWLNLCGEIEPATFVIQDSKCATIQIEGNYFEGVFLKERSNMIFLEVSVSTPGRYSVEATAYHAGNPNGYAFQGTGIFPDAGNYHIALRGSGTPIKGYTRDGNGAPTSPGDEIKFVLNGKTSNCVIHNFVEKESLKYKISHIESVGQFFTGINLNHVRSGNLEVTITNITMGGTVEINTLDNNGIRFSGRRVLTNAEIAAKTAKIILRGQGAPVVPRNTPLDFFTNSHVQVELGQSPEFYPYTVRIEPLTVDFYCADAQYPISHEGSFEYNVTLTPDNKIHVPLKVRATGRGEVKGTVEIDGTGYGNQTEKIEFTSGLLDFTFNDLRDDVQNVVLTPKRGTGKPTVSNRNIAVKMKLTSRGAHEYDSSYPIDLTELNGCTYDIPVSGAPVQYEVDWSRARVIGKLRPYKPVFLTGPNQIEVPVKVIFPGEAVIETTKPVNGITYKGTRLLTNAEVGREVVMVLTADGTPQIADHYRIELLGNSVGNAEQRGIVIVPVLYRPMVVLASGSSASYRVDDGAKAGLLKNPAYFGPHGIVKVERVTIISGNHSTASNFTAALRNNKVDIVIGSYNFGFDRAKNDALYEFLVLKRGAAMIVNEVHGTHAANFINQLAGGGAATISSASTDHILININDPLLKGPFGDLGGKMLGEDRIGRKINNLPSSYINYDADPSKAWAVRHNQRAFVYVGDSGFFRNTVYGVSGNASNATVAPGSGSTGDSRAATYNSHFTMNFLAWAIDYVQRTTDEHYYDQH